MSEHDIFAEEALLDGLFSGRVSVTDGLEVFRRVTRESFFDQRLGLLFEAAATLFADGPQLVDSVAAIDLLRRNGTLQDAGGATHVAEVTSGNATGASVTHWARLVFNQARKRRMSTIAKQVAACAHNPVAEVGAAASAFAEVFQEIAVDGDEALAVPIRSLLKAEFNEIQRRHEQGGDLSVSTGFYDLDNLVGGFVPGELTILAGRPGMGKTSLALAFALNVARSGKFALVFSLEMAAQQLAHRFIAMHSGITSRELRQPRERMHEKHWPALTRAITETCVDTLDVVDSARVTVNDIRAAVKARSLKSEMGLVVIDYLQLVRPAEKSHSREREVAEISAELKAIAKDLRVPVVCLAQLNRATEQQNKKQPQLSNLRESGSIEQDADVVLFVHRDGYYDASAPQDVAKIIVAKNRNGAPGPIEVHWNATRTLFSNLEQHRQEDRRYVS